MLMTFDPINRCFVSQDKFVSYQSTYIPSTHLVEFPLSHDYRYESQGIPTPIHPRHTSLRVDGS